MAKGEELAHQRRKKVKGCMIMKTCARCGRMIQYGSIYCKDCIPIMEQYRKQKIEQYKKNSNRKYNKKRNPKYSYFYKSKDWRKLSLAALQRDGYRCVRCGAIATEVHHVIPIQIEEGWNKRFEFDGIVSLCTKCHNKEHERFQKKRMNDSL